MCYDLTIDIGILMSGSNKRNTQYFQTSHRLMNIMSSKGIFFLALDIRGKILIQYLEKLKEGTFGHEWLIKMMSEDKIKVVPWIPIDRGIKVEIKEAPFPIGGEDFKYVRTAASTICKYLVSHDPDYSDRACRVLRRKLEIKVKTACECHEL